MMIEVYGAGIAGGYLCNLLEQDGLEYIAYEIKRKTKCPSPCAFGWANYSKVKELVKNIGLDSDEYVTNRPKRILVNGVEFKIRDVVTFDKPRFIMDLRKNIKINYTESSEPSSDLIVDATGYKRAIIGHDSEDVTRLVTKQYKLKTDLDQDYIYIFGKPYGYAWAFPIGDYWHIGAGAFTKEQMIELLNGFIKEYELQTSLGEQKICSCSSPIIWHPEVRKVLFDDKRIIIAIGEAGGFVTAFGEGNTLAMETALCLYESIKRHDDPVQIAVDYLKRVTKETGWINIQYDFVRTLNRSWIKALFKLPKVFKLANKRNLDASLINGLRLFWKMRRK